MKSRSKPVKVPSQISKVKLQSSLTKVDKKAETEQSRGNVLPSCYFAVASCCIVLSYVAVICASAERPVRHYHASEDCRSDDLTFFHLLPKDVLWKTFCVHQFLRVSSVLHSSSRLVPVDWQQNTVCLYRMFVRSICEIVFKISMFSSSSASFISSYLQFSWNLRWNHCLNSLRSRYH